MAPSQSFINKGFDSHMAPKKGPESPDSGLFSHPRGIKNDVQTTTYRLRETVFYLANELSGAFLLSA